MRDQTACQRVEFSSKIMTETETIAHPVGAVWQAAAASAVATFSAPQKKVRQWFSWEISISPGLAKE